MRRWMFVALFGLLIASVIFAQLPQTISFQGKLVEDGTPVNDTRDIHFYLYDVGTGGTSLWDEDHLTVPVVGGLFNVELGAATTFASAGVDFLEQYWVGITVGGGTEIDPRYKLTASPYAIGSDDGDWQISGDNMYSLPSGNVGIGITTPEIPFHLVKDGIPFIAPSPPSPRLNVAVQNAARTAGVHLGYDDTEATPLGVISSTNSNGGLAFWTHPYTEAGERMRITRNGNVGIGTTSPTSKLHVIGDIYCTGKLTSDGGNDPPYVGFTMETRKAIIERVRKEIPAEKINQAVQFWNSETSHMEIYLPTKGEFRDLMGNLLDEKQEYIITKQ